MARHLRRDSSDPRRPGRRPTCLDPSAVKGRGELIRCVNAITAPRRLNSDSVRRATPALVEALGEIRVQARSDLGMAVQIGHDHYRFLVVMNESDHPVVVPFVDDLAAAFGGPEHVAHGRPSKMLSSKHG